MDQLTMATDRRHDSMMTIKLCGARVRALFEPLIVHQRILRQIVDSRLGEWLSVALFDLRNPKGVRERALARLQRLPERERLHAWDDELCHALDGKADEKMLSVMLAVMLDGFLRRVVLNVGAYIEAALLVLADRKLSPEIIAAAILRIWRKSRPSPSSWRNARELSRR